MPKGDSLRTKIHRAIFSALTKDEVHKKVKELHGKPRLARRLFGRYTELKYICEGIYKFQPCESCWGNHTRYATKESSSWKPNFAKSLFKSFSPSTVFRPCFGGAGARLVQWTWPSQCGCCHGSGYTTRIGFACRTSNVVDLMWGFTEGRC